MKDHKHFVFYQHGNSVCLNIYFIFNIVYGYFAFKQNKFLLVLT